MTHTHTHNNNKKKQQKSGQLHDSDISMQSLTSGGQMDWMKADELQIRKIRI